jgi:hypothetical protein
MADRFEFTNAGAMQAFQHIAKVGAAKRRVGAFPTFHLGPGPQGLGFVPSGVFLTEAAAVWSDVPLAALNNPSLNDFTARMCAANTYATQQGYVGGFPTYDHADHGKGVVCGTVLLKSDGAEFRDVPWSDLGSPALADFGARFKATHDYALRNGFVGGFPTLFHAVKQPAFTPRGVAPKVTVCGTVLLKQDSQQVMQTGGTRTTHYARLMQY